MMHMRAPDGAASDWGMGNGGEAPGGISPGEGGTPGEYRDGQTTVRVPGGDGSGVGVATDRAGADPADADPADVPGGASPSLAQ